MTRLLPVVASALLLCASAAPAFAADPALDVGKPELPSPRHGSAKQDFHFNGGPGYAHDEVLGGVVAHSLTLGYRYGYFEPALVGDFGTRFYGGSYASLSMSLGAVVQTDSGPRLTLRGLIGSDSYTGVGCELFCRSGGAAATLPYAGVRAGASHVFWSRGNAHFELGLEGFYGHDLGEKRVRYSTTGGLFGPTTVSGERLLGGERIGMVLTAGFTFDTAVAPKPSGRVARR